MRALPLLAVLPLAAQSFDADRLRTGDFDYRITDATKEVAKLSLHIRKAGSGRFAFSADATAAACQHWESVATGTLDPVSALLSFCKDGNNRPVFELTYAGGRVSGARYAGVPPAAQKREVAAAIPGSTVDQRIDWAAVMAMDLKPGMAFDFNVYDPGTGLSRLTGAVGEVEQVEVPAGRFPAYRVTYQMEKPGGVERYEGFVTRETPRVSLRIRFPNGTASELVRMR